MLDKSMFSFNLSLFQTYLEKRDIELQILANTDIVLAKKGNHIEYLVSYQNRLIPSNYYIILDDKYYSKNLMKERGYSVSEASVFDKHCLSEICEFAQKLGYPVVLKKTNGAQGHNVYPNLKNEEELKTAFLDMLKSNPQFNILVEKHFEGDDYRFFMIDGVDEPFVIRRTAPIIVGDGVSTLDELITKENYRRLNPRSSCLSDIYMKDGDGMRALNHQKLTLDSIPKKGQTVRLRYNANVSRGGQCEALGNDQIHPSYIELAKSIHRLFPGLGYTSVDLLIHDESKPCSKDSYVFCEFNTGPGFSLHHMPGQGTPQNILDPIIDLLFPETKK